MLWLLSLLLALPLSASSLPAPSPSAIASQNVQPARIQQLLRRLRERRIELDPALQREFVRLIGDVRLLWAVDPARERECAEALLDLAGMFLDVRSQGPQPDPGAELQSLAFVALRAHMSGEFARYLAVDVVATPRLAPLERRLAAIRLIEERTYPIAKLALIGAARESDARLRRAALHALMGWEDGAVHELFFEELERYFRAEGVSALDLCERHFAAIRMAPKSRLHARYVERIRAGLVALDWRAASLAAVLTRPLENESAVPYLIEALATWRARGERGEPVLRIRLEIEHELKQRLGGSFGADVDAWVRLWSEARNEKPGRSGPVTTGGRRDEGTRPSFFGLRPETERVIFVIDRSGSMQTAFNAGTRPASEQARRRWDVAVKQLLGLLEGLSPKTHFDVVLFHDLGEAWKGTLQPLTPANLNELRHWLLLQKPNGSTALRAGIDQAMHMGSAGAVDLTRVEADTLILLCDGETNEGPNWVEGFLRDVYPLTRIRIHGVQVGGSGDGTLERLARGTGGEFEHVDG